VPNTVRRILVPQATEPDSASTRRRRSSSRQWPRSTAGATSRRMLAISFKIPATTMWRPQSPDRTTIWKNMPRSSKGGSAWKMMTSWCTTKTVVLNASPTTVGLRGSATGETQGQYSLRLTFPFRHLALAEKPDLGYARPNKPC
jgi:hypothetical protein